MKKGVLLINGSLHNAAYDAKFEELYGMFRAAAARRGAELIPLSNTELALPVRQPVAARSCGAYELGQRSTAGAAASTAQYSTAGGAEDALTCAGRGAVPGAPVREDRIVTDGSEVEEGQFTLRDGDRTAVPQCARAAANSAARRAAARPLSSAEKCRAVPPGTEGGAQGRDTLPPPLADADFVLFWDKDVFLARALERAGLRVKNSARAVELCDDKRLTHEVLTAAGLPMPTTLFAPLVFRPCGWERFADGVEGELRYPVVVKEAFGSFGAQVHLARNRAEFLHLCDALAPRPFLVSEFVAESAGRDVRLQVVGGEVVAAMERRAADGDFRAGLTSGGSMHPFDPPAEAIALAVRAAAALDCDFAGVDLLFGAEGFTVCEVNSNAHFKNLYDLTGVNTAEFILDWLLR